MVTLNLASNIKKHGFLLSLSILATLSITGLNLFSFKTQQSSPLTQELIKYITLEQTITIKNGDTFFNIISDLGINKKMVSPLIRSVERQYKFNNLQVNNQLKFIISDKNGCKIKNGKTPDNIAIYIDNVILKGSFNNEKNSYEFNKKKQRITTRIKFIEGSLGDILYKNILNSGATSYIAGEYIRLLKNEVNFRKDLKKDTKFRILFKVLENSSGTTLNKGEILYASLSTGKKEYNLYKFKNKKHDDYFLEDGNVIDSAFFTKPIPGARVSSGYGYRIHPITGRKKFHRGIDFAAKKGTSIKAAASGVIYKEAMSRGYGRFIIIKHNNKFSTLYAHMHNFNSNVKIGRYVKKGEIIGYVGNTGLSTAPHLHYEVRQYNVPINPKQINMHSSDTLKGKHLVAFKSQKKRINSIIEDKSKIIIANKQLLNSIKR